MTPKKTCLHHHSNDGNGNKFHLSSWTVSQKWQNPTKSASKKPCVETDTTINTA